MISNSIPSYMPKINENLHPHKNLYMNAHSSICHNSQKVVIKVHQLINKYNVEYPYNGILIQPLKGMKY